MNAHGRHSPHSALHSRFPLAARFALAARFVFAALFALAPTVAAACLWDYDTLQQERSRFPEALELITGKFLRHSPEFYEWRIKDRLEKLKTEPTNLAYHDDLAVAYSKLGRTEDAITVMQAKDKLRPGLYETYANLGTFYILAGDFDGGLPYIDRALKVDPDAHFGRERYQKWLVEYVLACEMKDGKPVFPLEPRKESRFNDFYRFVQERDRALPPEQQSKTLRGDAVKGVLGMMRFATYDNPLLLEALADLLSGLHGDGQRLAARALLQASYGAKDEAVRAKYREAADQALEMQIGVHRADDKSHRNIEDDFRDELADAKRWYDELHGKELAWIRDGKNVDEEFDRLYTAEPKVKGVATSEPFRPSQLRINWPGTVGLLFGIFGAGTIGVLVWRRRQMKD